MDWKHYFETSDKNISEIKKINSVIKCNYYKRDCYKICWKVCLECLVSVLGNHDGVNKVYSYFEKVNFLK